MTPWRTPARVLCPWDFLGKLTGAGLPFPPPEDLPNPGVKPASPVLPALQVDSLPAEPSGKSSGGVGTQFIS